MFKQYLLVALTMLVSARGLQAQSTTPKFEIGIHFTALRLDEFALTDKGIGGRVGYHINSHLSIEGELNVLPGSRNERDDNFELTISAARIEGLFGPKMGIRRKRFGGFGKIRPGVLNSQVERRNLFDAGVVLGQSNTTGFALDLGGVVEFYPSRHTLIRFDAGDTLLRNRKRFLISLAGRPDLFINFTSHNFQLSAGVGWRF